MTPQNECKHCGKLFVSGFYPDDDYREHYCEACHYIGATLCVKCDKPLGDNSFGDECEDCIYKN